MHRDHHAVAALAALFSRSARTPDFSHVSPIVRDELIDAAEVRN